VRWRGLRWIERLSIIRVLLIFKKATLGSNKYWWGHIITFVFLFLLFYPLLSFFFLSASFFFKLSLLHMPFILLLLPLFLFFHSYIICDSLGTYYSNSISSLLLRLMLFYVLNNNISLLHLSLLFPPLHSYGLDGSKIWFVNFMGVIMVSFRHFPKLFQAILIRFNEYSRYLMYIGPCIIVITVE